VKIFNLGQWRMTGHFTRDEASFLLESTRAMLDRSDLPLPKRELAEALQETLEEATFESL
jgi:hypothetical protein